MPTANTKTSPRPFKSAEKPVSLHPLSFKQAVMALLQVGPLDHDPPPKSDRRASPESG